MSKPPNADEWLDPGDEPDTDDSLPRLSWTAWHRRAREYADSQYGLRRVPVDRWKTYYATAFTPEEAAKRIHEERS